MQQQLLLLEDIHGLGRSGDVVSAKPGYVRNFLLPQKKAVIADKQTLKMQTRLKEEREKRAAVDRKDAEELAGKLEKVVVTTEVKTDPDGKMYGSVSSLEVARLMQEQGYQIERKQVLLSQPIKNLGTHTVNLRLKEGVLTSFTLEVVPEAGSVLRSKEKPKEETAAQ